MYLPTARIDGVSCTPENGSDAGASTCGSSCFRNARHHTIAPIPASNRITLAIDHSTFAAVGRLSISGSCGQLLVYVTAEPGRFVAAAQDVQKKNAFNFSSRPASGTTTD